MKLIMSIFCVVLVGSNVFAQNVQLIDNTPENAIIFDANDPASFMFLIRNNSGKLRDHEFEGISNEDYNSLTTQQKEEIIVSIGRPGTIPIIDEELDSERFGEALIVKDSHGFDSFVYNVPDTTKICFTNIDRIIFEYTDGEGTVWSRITKMTFYKRYDQAYVKVLGVNAKDVLKMERFDFVRELDPSLNEQLVDVNNPSSLWNTARDASLNFMKGPTNRSFSNRMYKHEFFPRRYTSFRHTIPSIYYSEDLSEKLYLDSNFRPKLHSLFEKVHYNYSYGTTPLMNEDPNSAGFGELLIVRDEGGLEHYVYDDPEAEYFWIDYSNAKIYAEEEYELETDGTSVSKVNDLYFTTEIDGVRQVVSHLNMSPELYDFFKTHEPLKLHETAWYVRLQQILNL